MKKPRSKKIYYICLIFILLLISIAATTKSFQNDTFYTIKVGESILKHGVDGKEYFSFLPVGYIYPHWLYDVMIYGIYHFFGFFGIYLSSILFSFGLGVLCFLLLRKLYSNDLLSFALSVFTLASLSPFITARAQLVSYLFFLIEAYELEQMLKEPKKSRVLILLLMALLVANFHSAVFPFFFVLFLPYFGEYLLMKIVKKKKQVTRVCLGRLEGVWEDNVKYLFLTFFLCLPMGLLVPNGFTPYTYYILTLLGDSTSHIMEHSPSTIFSVPSFYAYLLFLFLSLLFTKGKIRLSHFFLLLGLSFMSFLSKRNVSLLLVTGVFALANLLRGIHPQKLEKWNDQFVYTMRTPIALIIIVGICLTFSMGKIFLKDHNKPYVTSDYPVELVDYIQEQIDYKDKKFFNEYNYGSYLLFRGLPVFIDSRCDLYLKEFNGKETYLEDVWKLPVGYEELFQKHDFDYIITTTKGDLHYLLKKDTSYKEIVTKGNFVLYQRAKNSA